MNAITIDLNTKELQKHHPATHWYKTHDDILQCRVSNVRMRSIEEINEPMPT